MLTSVRGKPTYNGFITINTDETFILRKNYQLTSEPISMDMGFAEEVVTDTAFLEGVDDINYVRGGDKTRMKYEVNASNKSVIILDGIETANKLFELKEFTANEISEKVEDIDYGNLQVLKVDTSPFDGVRGAKFGLWTTTE